MNPRISLRDSVQDGTYALRTVIAETRGGSGSSRKRPNITGSRSAGRVADMECEARSAVELSQFLSASTWWEAGITYSSSKGEPHGYKRML